MTDCVIWLGKKDRDGYGLVGHNDLAHRRAYLNAVGPIPVGHVLHHVCLTRACVNPDHLVPVTRAEHNAIHGALISHCSGGHEYTAANTYWRPNGRRDCRTCGRLRQQRCRERKAA